MRDFLSLGAHILQLDGMWKEVWGGEGGKGRGEGDEKKNTKKQNLPENKCSGGYGEIGILVCY